MPISTTLLKGDLLVATLQLRTASTYEENLSNLISIVKKSKANLLVAPELALTNFDYEHFEEASAFYDVALAKLLELISDKILVLTLTKKENNNFYNQAVVLHNHQIVYRQNKYKLFTLGEELKYFKAGEEEKIVSFTINGVNYALLICFELRFKALWKQLEGVEVVLLPARWGKTRKKHLETLSQALAIMNQCFVVLSNSADEDMASSSSIISPWGEVTMNDGLEVIEKNIHLKEVKKVRRMIKMM
jgi:predicted amidohydrolase